MDVVARLRELARENFAASAAELRRVALRHGVARKAAQVSEALKTNVASQVLAQKPRFLGKAAADAPGSRVQLDLAEFSATANDPDSTPFALVATDVYTRQTQAVPLASKSAEATDAAARAVLDKMPNHAANARVTTDSGGEFSSLQSVLDPRHSWHSLKHGLSDLAVVDRTMQELKRKLAVAKANEGGTWDSHLKRALDAYNNNPRAAVHGPPATAGDSTPQGFMVMQDNARAMAHNNDVTQERIRKLQEGGAFRPSISDGARAHKPRYGRVENLGSVEPCGLHVISEDGKKHLLKTVLPVARGTEEPKAVFGTRAKPPPRDRAEGEAPRARPHRPMTGRIPKPASSVFAPPGRPVAASSSSSAPAVSGPAPAVAASSSSAAGPAFANPCSRYLAAMFGGHEPKRTPEERARIKAEAARKRQEAEDKRQAKEAARKQKEREADARREAKALARGARKR